MLDPVSLTALGVAIGKLLLRWGDLNDTADALQDAQAGFSALRSLKGSKAHDPVGAAITELLKQRLAGVRDPGRRQDMQIAVANVAGLFTSLTDDDIRAAAQHPGGFPRYLARGSGRTLLAHTEEALTPFTAQLIATGGAVFAELAPRSGRFTAAALVRLLNQVDATLAGLDGLHDQIAAGQAELLAEQDRATGQLEALQPKVDAILHATTGLALVVEASREATLGGQTAGPPVAAWDPGKLGVHDSIVVDDQTGLTAYLARDHDHDLRDLLEQARSSSRAVLVLVVGTSCTGKTRTLYEAVLKVLPDWQTTASSSDSDLARTLTEGVPARTLVWLDELQDLLPATPSGITAAKAITELLDADDVGPIVFAGTLWPTDQDAMRNRPDADKATTGAGAISKLLARAADIEVPEVFTDSDLEKAIIDDPRLQLAIDTATHIDHPDGRKVTQVLAGGTQLVHRLYPPDGARPTNQFSPAARAVLHAAADLRRIGHPNPLPRWAIEGAASGYLDPPDHRPPDHWLPAAFEDTTKAARGDDALTGTYVHDHHSHGVPALTPHWTTTPDGPPLEAYDLHDYLLEDHLTRHKYTPTRPTLWASLTSNYLPPTTANAIAGRAFARRLLTVAADLTRPHADNGDPDAQIRLIDALARLGDPDALHELRTRADRGDPDAPYHLAEALAELGYPDAIDELRGRSNNGEYGAWASLIDALAFRGTPKDLDELESHIDQTGKLTDGRLFMWIALAHARPDALQKLRTDVFFGLNGGHLLSAYRSRSTDRWIAELDCHANPVYEE